MKVSFGKGSPARVPWISFLGQGMSISHGIYPVYLYYKDLETLILAYGVSETSESSETWPAEILNTSQKIEAFLNKKVPRYGSSFVFKTYKINQNNGALTIAYADSGELATPLNLNSDLNTIVEYYKTKVLNQSRSSQSEASSPPVSEVSFTWKSN